MPNLMVLALVAAAAPAFEGAHGPLPPDVRATMVGSSWREGCPVPIEDLAYIKVKHWGYDGAVHDGELVVHRAVAAEVIDVLRELYEARFPVERMELVDAYGADDLRSMEANNTSAFNCRPIHGRKDGFSTHSYGRAIDVNPKTNPYVRGTTIAPPSGAAYVDRSRTYEGGIVAGGPCHRAFVRRGWRWGGGWRSMKDYQHFEKPGPS